MDGFIFVNKSVGLSSYDVIRRLKRILPKIKIGHVGTLDPLASGLMIICVGRATRFASFFDQYMKEYEMIVSLGFETDTLDLAGKVVKRIKYSGGVPEIEKMLSNLEGEHEQVPPKFSAVKYKGQRAYRLASKGKDFSLKAKKINISNLRAKIIDDSSIYMKASVSKGTYLRSIAKDMGEKLGCCGTAIYINRTAIGNYSLKDALTLEEIKHNYSQGAINFFRPLETFFDFNTIELKDSECFKFRNGIKLPTNEKDGYYRISSDKTFVGYGVVEDNNLKVYKYFH